MGKCRGGWGIGSMEIGWSGVGSMAREKGTDQGMGVECHDREYCFESGRQPVKVSAWQ